MKTRKQAAALLRRLYALARRQIEIIEARHKKLAQEAENIMTLADSEKEARTLASLTRQIEKMVELETRLANEKQGEGVQNGISTQQLRENLTQRLANFEDLSSGGGATSEG